MQVRSLADIPDIVNVSTAAQVDPGAWVDAHLACLAGGSHDYRGSHVNFQNGVHGARVGVSDITILLHDSADLFSTLELLFPSMRVTVSHQAHAAADLGDVSRVMFLAGAKVMSQTILKQGVRIDRFIEPMRQLYRVVSLSFLPHRCGLGLCLSAPGRNVSSRAQRRKQRRQQFCASEQDDVVFAARQFPGEMIDQVLWCVAADRTLKNFCISNA